MLDDTSLLDYHPFSLTLGSPLNSHVPKWLNTSRCCIIYHLEEMNFKVLAESGLWQKCRREILGVWMSVSDGQVKHVRFVFFILLFWNSSHSNVSLPNSTYVISSGCVVLSITAFSLVVAKKEVNGHISLVCWGYNNKIPRSWWVKRHHCILS